ncbi:NAD(P)-binding protein [Periconia macrospinosa]|uniref:NAD(P)-binding protein n=1 Tax=Periconia macrospinosa TaxID=97972 RepID=A0A2V1DEK0_9PLEO|nr:NAD(P)-binding protein [Periconia macrospinosa]
MTAMNLIGPFAQHFDGFGYHTVAHLAKHGAHVYMGARSASKAATAISSIKTQHPTANITHLQLDHTNLTSVVAATTHFLTLETSLHGLVNNAGIMASPYSLTRDNHEIQFQTNYLAHWVLTTRLLPLLLHTSKTLPAGSVRIVNVSSSGHLRAPKGGIHFADPSLASSSNNNTPWYRYGQSKLANILHSHTLHTTYGPGSASARNGDGEIWTTSVHPGVVATNLTTTVDTSESTFSYIVWVMRKLGLVMESDEGSWTNVYCVAGQGMKREESGKYMDVHKRMGEIWWLSGYAKDKGLAERLEGWTREVMGREGWVGE